jgi:hypothetical protein
VTVDNFGPMQEGPEEAYLREMAKKCRLLAGQLLNEIAAASLRKLAEEYEEGANAAEQRSELHLNQPPTG